MKNLDNPNITVVSNTIQLISKFLDRYEGKKSLKPEMKLSQQFSSIQPINITVFNKNDNQRRQISISYFQTLGHLRQKIADAFEMQMNEFIMQIKNMIVDPDEDDDRYVKDSGLFQ